MNGRQEGIDDEHHGLVRYEDHVVDENRENNDQRGLRLGYVCGLRGSIIRLE